MTTRRSFIAAGLGLCSLAALSGAAFADSHKGIVVDSSFARASASPMVKTGAAYITVTNKGDMPDRLIAAKGTAAKRIELHTHKMVNGAMAMIEIEGGVPIAPDETISFKPGGDHIMFIGLNAPLVEGESVPLVLVFEKAGEIAIHVPIKNIAAMGGMNHDAMNHGEMNKTE